MRLPSLFALRRRASSRLRPARRPAACRLAVEVLEGRDAPGSLAPDLGIPVFDDLSNHAVSDLTALNQPTTTIAVNLDNGRSALPSAERPSPWAPPGSDSRAPASDSNSDQHEVAPSDSPSVGSLAALLAASGPAHAQIRFKAWENGISTFTPKDPTTLHEEFTSVGRSTSGGPFTGIGSDDFNLVTGDVTNGQFTWTFHAGTVYGTYDGTAVLKGEGTADFWLNGKIEGGTGAFERVTGSLSLSGTGKFTDPTTIVWSATIEGTLFR